MFHLIKKLFGSSNERTIKKYQVYVHKINELETEMKALSESEVIEKTAALKKRCSNGESLDSLLPEAFALVRSTSEKVLNMRHFDVQLIGGVALHNAKVSEMRTGEGKTVVATLTAYLNALTGRGIHIVTVNDYLARRDAEWMGKLYTALGLSTGVIVSGMMTKDRISAYACDIVYATNNELGFDYLRDNMVFSHPERVQRDLHFAIIDEVDSILIDEARTPLIISGTMDDQSKLYTIMNDVVKMLSLSQTENDDGDFTIDEKVKQTYLTEIGHEHIEQILKNKQLLKHGHGLYDPDNISILHYLNAALRAYHLFHKDVDYIIQNNEVIIVDEFTGRTMPGRRWSDSLHQAIEAKENVPIQNENQTLATITYQNYFRLYEKLSGMTGTADTEAYEFQQIYGLEVMIIPTHQTMIRDDMNDLVYLTAKEKYDAIIKDIKERQACEQPILVGTASIEVSEYLSSILKKEHIDHQVLNAKFHQKEAEIIAQAGHSGSITIATNMAGRGTDIVLGGNYQETLKHIPEDKKAATLITYQQDWETDHQKVITNGGLHIIGTERHESRRIDNQLRGRSGRQGDPGSSRFYLSLEDNLMRIFASEKIATLMKKLDTKGEAIEAKIVTRSIENAQRKVEAHNFDIRKNLLEYDDIANDQRKVIYQQRNEILENHDISENIKAMRDDVINAVITTHIPEGSMEEAWDITGLCDTLEREFKQTIPIQQWLTTDKTLAEKKLREKIVTTFHQLIVATENNVSPELARKIEQHVMLNVLDRHWREHLVMMDHLRQGIQLRSFAAKNPKQEYRRESYYMFVDMLENIKRDIIYDIIMFLSHVDKDIEEKNVNVRHQPKPKQVNYHHSSTPNSLDTEDQSSKPFVHSSQKTGRNEPCPCGSGKKYKKCHGKIAS